MKKCLALLLVLSMVLTLAACGGKQPLSVQEFHARVADLGYRQDDDLPQIDYAAWGISQAGYAWKKTGETEIGILLAIFPNSRTKDAALALLLEDFVSDPGSTASSGSNWEQHRLQNGEEIYVLACVDNTLLVLEALNASDAEVDKVLEALGY